MRKNLNKLATLALSGMMVMSMAVPAFAAQNFDAPVLKKVVYTDGHTHAPNTTFTFTVKWDSTTKKFTEGDQEVDLNEVKPEGKAENTAVTVAGIQFTPVAGNLGERLANDTDPEARVFKGEGAITVDTSKFPGKGYYLFDLKEDDGKYEGIRYDNNNYKLFVIIYEDATGSLKSKVSVYRANAEKKATSKTEYIGNNYGRENTPPNDPENPPIVPDTPDNDIHDVTIKKRVTGSMRDENKKFELAIKVTSSTKGKPASKHEFYEVTGEGITGPTAIESDVTEAKVFNVMHGGEGIRIRGLSDGDMITVTEQNGETYTMTVKEDTNGLVAAKKDNNGFFEITNNYTTKFAAKKNGAKVTVTNNKDSITPTGIVMNVAPYAMMLAVAGGLGVVFMNRKKEEE